MMRKYHVRFGGGARVPEGSPALPYPTRQRALSLRNPALP